MTNDVTTLRNEIEEYIYYRLSGDMVDVELDPGHYRIAIDKSIKRYRQRAANAVEESYLFLSIVEGQQEYIMPDEVLEVRQLFRRSVGGSAGSTSSSNFEPFEAAYVNTYILQAGRVGGLLSYELFYQYQEMAARLFGGHVNFTFNPVTKKLTVLRKFTGSDEQILIWAYNRKPESMLLQDYTIRPWIEDYSLALCMQMLGEARSKFATIAGPQGGTSLNGDALKAEGKELQDKLDEELKNYITGSDPLSFRIG